MKLELYSPRRAVFGATLAVLIFGVPPSAADSIWIAAQTHGILRMGGGRSVRTSSRTTVSKRATHRCP